MTNRLRISLVNILFLLAISLPLLSFKPGGEGFEIFINGKALLTQFGKEMNSVKSLQFRSDQASAQLTIRYHHCGKYGKQRTLSLRNSQQKLMKQWKFGDAGDGMNFSIKDLTEIRQLVKGELYLVYSSAELPEGRTLFSIEP